MASRALGRIAAKYDSQALEADALHFSTDIWSSGIVVVGLALVLLGRMWKVDWLRDADPVAALCVAAVVVYVSWRLARKTIDALLDAAPAGVRNKIIAAVSSVDGLLEIDRVRIRRAGNRYFRGYFGWGRAQRDISTLRADGYGRHQRSA